MKSATCLLVLYLLGDLVTPGLPGIFEFEEEQSIEAARNQRSPRAHLPVAADITPPAFLDTDARVPLEEPMVPARPLLARAPDMTWSPPLRNAGEPAEVDPSETA